MGIADKKETKKTPMSARKQWLIGLTILLLAGIGGYVYYQQTSADNGGTSPLDPSGKTAKEIPLLTEGAKIPAFRLSSIDGQYVSLGEYQAKKKPILFEFFASWCPHCQHSAPILKKFYEKHKAKLIILGINAGDRPGGPSTSLDYQAAYKIDFPILERPFPELLDQFHVQSFPTFYLTDSSGTVLWAFKGTLTPREVSVLEAKLSKLTH